MAFAPTQIRKLKAKLKVQHIKTRDADGVALNYLEGWHVVAEANRIFGFGGWDRENVASTCVWTKQIGSRFAAAYMTRVRITVRAGDERIIREGSGAGESNAASPGQAHEFAAKAAETDATKRALSTFGNSFGLSLYAGSSDLAARTAANGHAGALGAPLAPISMVIDPMSARGGAEPPAAADNGGPTIPIGDPPAWPDTLARRPIDKSLLALPELKRMRSKDHLRYVATQPCCVCGRQPTEAHHLKFTQPSALSRKVSDEYTVPLCALHHRDLHTTGNEIGWWERKSINPISTALCLWNESHFGSQEQSEPVTEPIGIDTALGDNLS